MLLARLRSLLRNLLNRDRVDRDLDDEMRAVLEELVDEHVRAGMSPAEARRAAMLQLGGIEPVKQQVRDVRSGAVIDALFQDVGYALRVLRRSPLFAATAVLSLAIGMAGTAVVFSLADAYLFRDPPGVENAHRLGAGGRIDPGGGGGVYGGGRVGTLSYSP